MSKFEGGERECVCVCNGGREIEGSGREMEREEGRER